MSRFSLIGPIAALAAVLAIAAIATGCGGSSGENARTSETTGPNTSVTTSSITTAEYIDRANGVCDEAWPRMLYSFERRYGGTLKGKPFAAASKNIFLPSLQIQFDDIHYIGAPEGEQEQVEEMVDALQAAVYSGEKQTITLPAQMVKIFAKFNRLASQYGIDSCPVEEASFQPK